MSLLKYLGIFFCFFCFLCCCASCVSVQEYEKMYLNEEEMALEAGKLESYELSFQSYREGASGANGAAVGGGCGCR